MDPNANEAEKNVSGSSSLSRLRAQKKQEFPT
jgi:hypothetical protein